MHQSQHVAAGNTVFTYEFARLTTPEIQPGGNIHGVDGGYVLGTFASDVRLSDQMQYRSRLPSCATGQVNIGDSCLAFAGSPIVWTRTAAGTSDSLAVAGSVTDGARITNWTGGFSIPITGTEASSTAAILALEYL